MVRSKPISEFNRYTAIARAYQDILNEAAELPTIENRLGKYKQLSELSSEVDMFKSYFHLVLGNNLCLIKNNNTHDIDARLYGLKDFVEFLMISEKVYMYNNTDMKSVYAEAVDDRKSNIHVIDEENSVHYIIQYEDSSIRIPDNSSSLLGFLNDDSDVNEMKSDNLVFINLIIKRTNGNKTDNISFIHGSEIPTKSEYDILMIENALNMISKLILNCIYDILDNYVINYTNIERNIGRKILADEVLNIGDDKRLWICRRNRFTKK